MVNLLAAVSAISDTQIARALTLPVSNSSPAPTETAAAAVPQTGLPSEAAAQAEARSEPSVAEVKQASKQLEQFMASMNRYLEFRVDEDSGRTVVTVKDKTTGETVRQIPSEEIMRLAHNLGGRTGSLVSRTA
jgi:flagellar protein FlaG